MWNQCILLCILVIFFFFFFFFFVLADTQASNGGMTLITYTVHMLFMIYTSMHVRLYVSHLYQLLDGLGIPQLQTRSHDLSYAYHPISRCDCMKKQRSTFIFHSDFVHFRPFLGEKCLNNLCSLVLRTVPTFVSMQTFCASRKARLALT